LFSLFKSSGNSHGGPARKHLLQTVHLPIPLGLKKDVEAKKKEYKHQLAAQELSIKTAEKEKHDATSSEFVKRENQITAPKTTEVQTSKKFHSRTMNSFWLPSNTPEAKETLPIKPPKTIMSPFGHTINLKELVPLTLTLTSSPSASVNEEKELKQPPTSIEFNRYICPVCTKLLNQVVSIVAISTIGTVMCKDCMEKLVKKTMTCPQTSLSFEECDILPLQSQATPYAGRTGNQLEAKLKTPAPRF